LYFFNKNEITYSFNRLFLSLRNNGVSVISYCRKTKKRRRRGKLILGGEKVKGDRKTKAPLENAGKKKKNGNVEPKEGPG